MQANSGIHLNSAQTFSTSGNQIIRAAASTNIDLSCGGTYQIAVGIKRFQKARLIGAGVWLNSP
jgi:hypothetical protein